MAVRTTRDLVSGIIEIDVDPNTLLEYTDQQFEDNFILPANELVTEVCASVVDGAGDPYYTDARLELIERWLSAHFYAVLAPRPTSEGAGSLRETFESKVDLNLAITRYGQQAMVLDTQGGLKRINLERSFKPSVVWLGTEL